ncbi:hypothetical protein [Halosimplex halophilum]|uniref:hypothetical protein n=1 Tax=Halosimplex halophilum TaxID=2559572 RepID=UPI00107F5847|nr:hypothetical protein [Halosimplex halophilum]
MSLSDRERGEGFHRPLSPAVASPAREITHRSRSSSLPFGLQPLDALLQFVDLPAPAKRALQEAPTRSTTGTDSTVANSRTVSSSAEPPDWSGTMPDGGTADRFGLADS